MPSKAGRQTALESSLKRSVLGFLARHYPAAQVRKRHGTAFTVAGDPDVFFLYQGVHFELELKQPGNSPTPLQTYRLTQWRSAGARTACIHSIPELVSFLTSEGFPPAAPPRPGPQRSPVRPASAPSLEEYERMHTLPRAARLEKC